MSELRRDPLVDRWVIIAPERADRPQPQTSTVELPLSEADDPFAEGRESETPGELFALRDVGTFPDQPGWRVRVVPNKYPAVRSGKTGTARSDTLFTSLPGQGQHEVLIECPHFETCLSRLSIDQVRDVFLAYRERLRFHRQQQQCAHVLIFKNKGRAAGATLPHTHSQLIGTPWVTSLVQQEVEASQAYWQRHGRPLWTDLLEQEMSDGQRIVQVTDRFVVLCPYASRLPFETRIVPREHRACFGDVEDATLHEAADLLRACLISMTKFHATLPYNLILHTVPFRATHPEVYRWHLEILPRIGQTAGFEWGGGCYINTVAPETAATSLKAAWGPSVR